MRDVTLYTRSMCIWCWRAKRLLRAEGVPFVERDARDDATRAWLLARTGRRTVPQVFFGDESVGGYDDLAALRARGELRARLEAT